MLASGDHARVAGLKAEVRRSLGLPPEATIVPFSSVDTPAQNMSWKLLSTLTKVSLTGSKTEAWVKVGPLGKPPVSVDDQDSTRPSGRFATEIAISGQAMTGPHEPKSDSFALV